MLPKAEKKDVILIGKYREGPRGNFKHNHLGIEKRDLVRIF